MNITHNDYAESGYKKYDVGILEQRWAISLYQKALRDNAGTKYHISVYETHHDPLAKIQLELQNGTMINLEIWCFVSLSELESLVETMFCGLPAKHYELQ